MAGAKYPTLWARLMAHCVVDETTGCWLWVGKVHIGYRDIGKYPRINIYIDGKTRTFRVHRLIAELITGRKLDPDEETIEHTCKQTLCINPNHLALATRSVNSGESRARNNGLSTEEYEMQMRDLRDSTGFYIHPSQMIPF